ncbi:MAG: porin family protein [Bacteroidales bacterium]
MKKYLLTIAFVFAIFTVTAQNFNFTVYGEPHISWMTPDARDAENGGGKIGFNAGFNFDNFFAQNYAFSTGISINKMPGKITYFYDREIEARDGTYQLDSAGTVEYNLQYIDIPIGLKFKTIEIGYTKFFAHLGLNCNINIKSAADFSDYKDINISNDMNWYNIGYYFGGGVEYSLGGSTAIVAGLTYRNGFLDVTKEKRNKVTTGNFSLRLGILF